MKKFTFGDKVTCDEWLSDVGIDGDNEYEVLSSFHEDEWRTSDEDGLDYGEDWKHYEEPKKKVTRWLWASKDDCSLVKKFMTSDEAVDYFGSDGGCKMLEWSATELEE